MRSAPQPASYRNIPPSPPPPPHTSQLPPDKVSAARCRCRGSSPFSWCKIILLRALKSLCYLILLFDTNPIPGKSPPPLAWRDISRCLWLVFYTSYIGRFGGGGNRYKDDNTMNYDIFLPPSFTLPPPPSLQRLPK